MIGILGGTFDPVHNGHLRVALDVLEEAGLDEIRLIPCNLPPHRPPPVASSEQRLAMLGLATAGQHRFVIDRRELDRPGPSYMIETLESFRREKGRVSLCLLLGSDAFLGLPSWHRWRELSDLAHVVVMQRPDTEHATTPELEQWLRPRKTQDPAELCVASAGKVCFHPVTQLEISASRIRQLAGEGRSVRYLVPDAVAHWIEEQEVYGTG